MVKNVIIVTNVPDVADILLRDLSRKSAKKLTKKDLKLKYYFFIIKTTIRSLRADGGAHFLRSLRSVNEDDEDDEDKEDKEDDEQTFQRSMRDMGGSSHFLRSLKSSQVIIN